VFTGRQPGVARNSTCSLRQKNGPS